MPGPMDWKPTVLTHNLKLASSSVILRYLNSILFILFQSIVQMWFCEPSLTKIIPLDEKIYHLREKTEIVSEVSICKVNVSL